MSAPKNWTITAAAFAHAIGPSFTLTGSTVMPFGKHKGRTGEYIARSDPSYILWVEQNVDRVRVDPRVRALAVCVGMMQEEESAERYGQAADWGFD